MVSASRCSPAFVLHVPEALRSLSAVFCYRRATMQSHERRSIKGWLSRVTTDGSSFWFIHALAAPLFSSSVWFCLMWRTTKSDRIITERSVHLRGGGASPSSPFCPSGHRTSWWNEYAADQVSLIYMPTHDITTAPGSLNYVNRKFLMLLSKQKVIYENESRKTQ